MTDPKQNLRRPIFVELVSLIGWCGSLGALFVCGLGLSAFLAPDFWLTDNMSFFLRQYLSAGLAGCIGGAVGLAMRHRMGKFYKTVWIAAVVALISLAGLTALRTLENTTAFSAPTKNRASLKVVSINIEHLFLGAPSLQEYLKQAEPDVLVLQETLWPFQERRWKRKGLPVGGLETGAFPQYRHVGDLGDLVIYSKFPITKTVSKRVPGIRPPDANVYFEADREILTLTLDTETGPLNLVALHPDSPRTKDRWQNKRDYFEAVDATLSGLKQDGPHPLIVIGDWNSAPWSARFQETLSSNDLLTAYPDGWPQTTRFFYDYRLHWVLGAPVDQVAVSRDVAITNVGLGPDIGSDHLPLEVDIELPD